MNLLSLILLVLVLCLIFGAVGGPAIGVGYYGYSPAALVLLVLLILLLTGRI